MDSKELQSIIPIPRIWENLEELENRLIQISSSSDSFLTEISQYLISAGGKRFRPLIALLAGELGDGDSKKVIDAGVSVELIHLGSLYHDDVIDDASTRRGVVSTNKKWNSTLSILAGDYLLARSSELAAESLGLESVKLLASTYAQLVEGQTKEVQYSYNTDHGTEDYMKIIEGKTASLIRTSARLGSMASNSKQDSITAISEWAWHNGIIFQITDDILDLSSDEQTLGKPSGNDILEGTYTLPVLIALQKNPEGIKKILDEIKDNKTNLEDVISEFNNEEIVSETKLFLKSHIKKSENAAMKIEDESIKNILLDLNEYLIKRSN
tara:strand:- start:3237 stop:4214 length:978 start_codon:yes stop_codon:yes gene_type:complete